MDLKKLPALLDKYFKGNTSQSEEESLKKHYSDNGEPDNTDATYFRYLHEAGRQEPFDTDFDQKFMAGIAEHEPAPTTRIVILKYWYLAASLVLILGLGYVYRDLINPVKQINPVADADTWEDPEKAFEETKKALLMLSSNLNIGEQYASEFAKFEKSQKNVKKN